jgi:propionate catabolism operon transcriptional regulator
VLAGVQEVLGGYAWPGNVRELQNVIERIVVELADDETSNGGLAALDVGTLRTIAPELFAENVSGRSASADAKTLRERSRHVEADQIRAALAACNGDRDAACQLLGISKTTLWRKLNAVK